MSKSKSESEKESQLGRESYHMSGEAFRRFGHELVDWIADYHESSESFPVLSRVEPGSIRKALPAEPPLRGEPFETILDDVNRIILPGVTHWQSPNFFAYFPSNSTAPAILGELLSAGLGVQGMIWATSPACTELETHVLDWLVDMLGLPRGFESTTEGGGVIQDTASSSALCALLAARERATELASNDRGVGAAAGLVAYTSNQAHSSIEKAVKIAGIGSDHLRLIGVDDAFAMSPGELRQRIERDVASGLKPFFVSATVGTTSSNAIDPLPEIGRICKAYNLWLHVDAAMSGTAALCPELRFIHEGVELADSYCFNPHKWMFTSFDCNAFYVKSRKALIDSLSILPEYLRNEATASGAVIDYRDWHIPLGRRFRALKLWFVIRHYGIEGLQHHIRRHVALTRELARWVEADDRFEIAAPVPLNLLCFRQKEGDAKTESILKRVNESGRAYLTHTKLDGRYAIRFCIGQSYTERRHVEAAWALIQEAATD